MPLKAAALSYREVDKIVNDNAEDILLLGNEWRLLLMVRTVRSAASEETAETMKRLNWVYKLLMDYCSNYKYSFGEEDVARTYPYDEYLRTFKDKWFNSI